MRHFYGMVKINPQGGAMQFSQVMTEVVNLLTADPGVRVEIKVDIHADSAKPFDKNAVIRPVTTNCAAIGFEDHGFEV